MKTLYAGAGLALISGLLLGGVMKPELALDAPPAAPQSVRDGPSPQPAEPPGQDANLANYHGKLPDYVLGTDWLKATQISAAPTPPEPAPVDYYEPPDRDDLPDPPLTAATYSQDVAAAGVGYASVEGAAADDETSHAAPADR